MLSRLACLILTTSLLASCASSSSFKTKSSDSPAKSPQVCGIWQFERFNQTYEFRCSGGGGAFTIMEMSAGGPYLSGDGVQVGNKVTATLGVQIGDQYRRVSLRLHFKDAQQLSGQNVENDPLTRGDLRFIRVH